MDSRGMQSFQDTGEDPLAMTDAAVQPDVEPCMLVIFGGAGDLARRKLIPALFELARSGICRRHYDPRSRDREDGRHGYRALLREAPEDDAGWAGFAQRISWLQGDFLQAETHERLSAVLDRSSLGNQSRPNGA